MSSAPELETSKSRASRLQAVGTLIVAVLILLITLVRYWRHIPWGAR